MAVVSLPLLGVRWASAAGGSSAAAPARSICCIWSPSSVTPDVPCMAGSKGTPQLGLLASDDRRLVGDDRADQRGRDRTRPTRRCGSLGPGPHHRPHSRPSPHSTAMGSSPSLRIVSRQVSVAMAIRSTPPHRLTCAGKRERCTSTCALNAAGGLTQRAVCVETAASNIVLGEAKVTQSTNSWRRNRPEGAGTITIVNASSPRTAQIFSFTGDLAHSPSRTTRGPWAQMWSRSRAHRARTPSSSPPFRSGRSRVCLRRPRRRHDPRRQRSPG